MNLNLKRVNLLSIDPCQTKKCGVGAQCMVNPNGEATCACSNGKIGNPDKRCCGK